MIRYAALPDCAAEAPQIGYQNADLKEQPSNEEAEQAQTRDPRQWYTRLLTLLDNSLNFLLSFCNLALSDLRVRELVRQFLDLGLSSR